MVTVQQWIDAAKTIAATEGLPFEEWLTQPSAFYNGQIPQEILEQISGGQVTDPLNQLGASLPDPLPNGSFLEDMGGALTVMALPFAVAGLAGAGVAGGAEGAGALGGFGEGALGSWDAVGGLTAAESAALGGAGAGASSAGGSGLLGLGTDEAALLGTEELAGGAAAGGATSGGGALTSGGSSALSALQRIIDGTGTTADWLSVLGAAAPGLIGAYGANQQSNALETMANQAQARWDQAVGFGAPYRQRLSDLYADPSSYLSSPDVQVPVQQGTDALARSLSMRGNPVGSGHALQELQNYSANQLYGRLGQERDRLAGFGGLTAYNQAAAQGPDLTAAIGALGAQGNAYSALGRSFGSLFGQQDSNSLDGLLRSLGYTRQTGGII